jgi:NTP pyrophosphatase (non-canonical NTP hydrolase)
MLTFDALRAANAARIPLFRNARGEPCHNHDGSDWSAADWLMALTGELGELANFLKKVKRGDFTQGEAAPHVAKELADVQIYLDLLAFRLGVDLGAATVQKFNEVSRRVKCDVFI